MAVIHLHARDYGPNMPHPYYLWTVVDITRRRWDLDAHGYRYWYEIQHYRFNVGGRYWQRTPWPKHPLAEPTRPSD